jgi:5-hydroxyisourate hydrolase-like protein (transthyretin family)
MRHLGIALVFASIVLTYPTVFAFGGESSQVHGREMDFALCREIPVGIVAGTPDHPRLVEIQWIRIEPKELPRGVTARVGWSTAAEATWRIAVDLLDDRRYPLPEARENTAVFTGKAGASADAGMHYADLDLGYKSFQTRRYATKVRIRLEPASSEAVRATSDEPAGPLIQIKVIDGKNRKPLADVTIVAEAYYEDRKLRSEVFLCSTDAEGFCRIAGLKPASFSFATQKDGYGMMLCSMPTPSPAQPAPGPKIVELRPAQPIGGVVQDQDGKPIADVEVRINAHSNEVGGMAYLNRVVLTDKDGRWRVNGVPSEADTVSLELHHLEYLSGYDWKPLSDELGAAQAFKHVEHMAKGANVDGLVLDAKGQPVPRAAVTLAPPRRGGFQYGYVGVLTDASGRFHFGCARDTRGDKNTGDSPTAVYVEVPGYAPMMKKIIIEPNVPPLEFRLSAGRTVMVRIVNSDGQPIPGASVQLYPLPDDPGNSISVTTTTDEQGRLQAANVPEGEMRMTVEKRGFLTVKDHVLPASAGEHTLTMTPGARVQGTVCDAETGQPIPSFRATLTEATDFDVIQFHQSGEFSEGKYEFSPKEKLSIDLWLIVSALGYKGAKSQAFRLEKGTRQMDFKLVKDPSSGKPATARPSGVRVVRGLVQDPNGRPAPKVTVVICPTWGADATTDAEGKFKRLVSPMGPTGPGTWYLVARDCVHNLAAVVRFDDTSTGDLLVRLAPGMAVTGRIVDPEGKAIPGVRLMPMFFAPTGHGQGLIDASKSDPNGYFEVRGLPPGYNYALRATANGYGEGHIEVRTVRLVGNRLEVKPLVLLPTNRRVSGVVVNSEGKPVPVINVCCSGGGQPRRETLTDARGRFTLENVCAGPITIASYTLGKGGLHGSVQAKSGDTAVRIVVTGGSSQSVPKSDGMTRRE